LTLVSTLRALLVRIAKPGEASPRRGRPDHKKPSEALSRAVATGGLHWRGVSPDWTRAVGRAEVQRMTNAAKPTPAKRRSWNAGPGH